MRPVLFYIPLSPFGFNDVPVYSYGCFMVLAFILGIHFAVRQARRDSIPENCIYDITLIGALTGFIGARLTYFLFLDTPGESLWDLLAIWKGGLVVYGGLIANMICCSLYIYWRKLPWGLTADCFAPGLAGGIMFGRLGCLCFGCCQGAVCPADAWYGLHFPVQSIAAEMQFYAGQISQGCAPLAVYPTQIMESLGGLAILLAILALFRWRRFPGQMMLWFFILYAPLRFVLEFWRDDTAPYFPLGNFPGFKLGQLMAMATIAPAIYLMIHWWNKGKPKAQDGAASGKAA